MDLVAFRGLSFKAANQLHWRRVRNRWHRNSGPKRSVHIDAISTLGKSLSARHVIHTSSGAGDPK
jgi:hypothetical protein